MASMRIVTCGIGAMQRASPRRALAHISMGREPVLVPRANRRRKATEGGAVIDREARFAQTIDQRGKSCHCAPILSRGSSSSMWP